MKKYSSILIASAAAALASCSGTKIEMTEYIPAKVNLHRDSTVAITYRGSRSDRVTDELRDYMAADEFYKFVSSDYPDYTIHVVDDTPLRYWVTYGKNGKVLYRKTLNQTWKDVGKNYVDFVHILLSIGTLGIIPYQPNKNEEKLLAKTIYHSFAPHEEKYTAKVDVSSDNPQLEHAVLACKKKNWELARQLTSDAILKNPKDAESYYLMGLLERNDAHYDKSNELFLTAMKLDPRNEKYVQAYDKNTQMQRNEAHVSEQLSE